eukprot:930731-Prorocentrum_minimum.AAC.2
MNNSDNNVVWSNKSTQRAYRHVRCKAPKLTRQLLGLPVRPHRRRQWQLNSELESRSYFCPSSHMLRHLHAPEGKVITNGTQNTKRGTASASPITMALHTQTCLN